MGIRADTHGFKDWLVSPAVVLDRARYLCAFSGPPVSPDSICQGGGMQLLPPLC